MISRLKIDTYLLQPRSLIHRIVKERKERRFIHLAVAGGARIMGTIAFR